MLHRPGPELAEPLDQQWPDEAPEPDEKAHTHQEASDEQPGSELVMVGHLSSLRDY